MDPSSVIRRGAIGLAAVVAPAAVMYVALHFTWSNTLIGMAPYLAVFCFALAVIAGLAWTCVRVARFPARVAIILTTLPFMLLVILSFPVPLLGLIWAVHLVIAVAVAHTATRRALQS